MIALYGNAAVRLGKTVTIDTHTAVGLDAKPYQLHWHAPLRFLVADLRVSKTHYEAVV